jgi:hypothetical protein
MPGIVPDNSETTSEQMIRRMTSVCSDSIYTYAAVLVSLFESGNFNIYVHMLCSEDPFYHGNYWQTDWPSTLRYRITSKDSTDTFIEQVQFTDFHRFFWKGSQKANCLSVYANEQSDILLARPLIDRSFPTWPSTHPFSDKASPYSLLCIRHDISRLVYLYENHSVQVVCRFHFMRTNLCTGSL